MMTKNDKYDGSDELDLIFMPTSNNSIIRQDLRHFLKNAKIYKDNNLLFEALIESIMNPTIENLAKIISYKNNTKYKPTDKIGSNYYMFHNHTWCERREILHYENDKMLIKIYKNILEKCTVRNEIYFKINNVINLLSNYRYIRHIMPTAIKLLYDPNFLENLDKNTNLLDFLDGIYDLTTNKFRDGTPEDLITIKNKCFFKPLVTERYKNDVMKELRGMHSNMNDWEYILSFLSDSLYSKIRNEILIIVTDQQYKLMNLLEITFGDTCISRHGFRKKYFAKNSEKVKHLQKSEKLRKLERLKKSRKLGIVRLYRQRINISKNVVTQLLKNKDMNNIIICKEIPNIHKSVKNACHVINCSGNNDDIEIVCYDLNLIGLLLKSSS